MTPALPEHVKTWARDVCLAVAYCLAALPASAFTISLTVSGTTYDVLFTQGSYDAVNTNPATPLTTTRWFGNEALANDLATALQAADAPGGGGAVVLDTSGWYNFTYRVDAIDAFNFGYAGTGPTFLPGQVTQFSGSKSLTGISASVNFYYASVAPSAGPAAVPEIDGNALAKALFLLFALHVWIQVRRNRCARG